MDQTMQQLISQYGYWLMAIGALLEGETFLIAGGIAAKHGLLGIPGLILLAWIGSSIHDNFFFFTGRYAGKWLLKKRPQWQDGVNRVYGMIDKYGSWVVIFMRFIYGFRIVIPVALGTTPMNAVKFVIFDIIGGLLWSATFIIGGYLFGELLDVILHQLAHYEGWIAEILIGFIVLCAVCLLAWWYWRRRKRS